MSQTIHRRNTEFTKTVDSYNETVEIDKKSICINKPNLIAFWLGSVMIFR